MCAELGAAVIPSELGLAAFLFGLCLGAVGVLMLMNDANRRGKGR